MKWSKMLVRKNNIFVKTIEEDIGNGLFIPPLFRDGMKETKLGLVMHCGPKALVKPGDTVVFGKWSGVEISYQGVQMLIIKSSHITAIK